MSRPMVIKVGGSLYTWPELPTKLSAWLAEAPGGQPVLVPGGGPFADAVRTIDAALGLKPLVAHRLAIGAMALGARLLQRIVPDAVVVHDRAELEHAWQRHQRPILDPERWFAERDDIPASWQVTSDSLALLWAQAWHAESCWLLKSTDVVSDSVAQWVADGVVDPWFNQVYRQQPLISVQLLNLRRWSPAASHAPLGDVGSAIVKDHR